MCVTDWWAKVTLEGISEAGVGMVISDISSLAPGKEKLQAEATTGSFQCWRRCKKQDSAAVVTEGGKGEHSVCSCVEAAAFQTQWDCSLPRLTAPWSTQLWGQWVGAGGWGRAPHRHQHCGGSTGSCGVEGASSGFSGLEPPMSPWERRKHMADRVWEHMLVCKGSLGSPRNKTGKRGSGGRSQWSAVTVVNVMFIFLFQFLFF